MNRSISFTPRRIVLVGLLGLVAVMTFGFAAANAVPASNAGDGTGAISGYTVTNLHYTLNSTSPGNTTNVSFTLAPPLAGGGTQRVSFDNGATWLAAGACAGTTNVSCAAAVPVLSLATLRIVAAD